MDIATKLNDLANDLRKGRTNLIAKGVDVSNTAGFSEVMDRILEIQSTVSTGTVVDDSISAIKQVPVNSISHCYVQSIGGMTTRDEETNTLIDNKATAIKAYGANLITFPYYSKSNTLNGITTTVNDDGSITFNGTATDQVQFVLAPYPIPLLPNESYILSGDNFVNGFYCSVAVKYDANLPALYTNVTSTYPARVMHKGYAVADLRIIIQSGTVCNNFVFKPMINIGTTAVSYIPYHEPVIYSIPEALQGTGKGVEGAADTIDFENGKKITKAKTIALGDVSGYQMNSFGGTEDRYITDDGLVAVFSYDVKDFDTNLRTKALCSHLPIHTDWSGKTYGVVLVDNGNSDYVKVSIRAADAGISTSDGYDTIIGKVITWLRDNNVTLTYAIGEPTETNIDTFAFDPLIKVEGGGSLEIITDNGGVVPSTIIYQTIV